jgi:glycerol-3-phosphate acyltransferase PlsY
MMDIIYTLIALGGGYLLGSIPFGLVLTRMAGLGDIRTIGSGNIGATNVLRTGHKGLAVLTLIADSGKGAFAVYLFMVLLSPAAALAAALGSVLGHLFPVWLQFKGGKGVATTLGVLLVLVPIAGILVCATWLVSALTFRISSLSALIATGVAPFYTWLVYGSIPATVILIISALIFVKHWDNIQRLVHGTEPKIGQKKAS